MTCMAVQGVRVCSSHTHFPSDANRAMSQDRAVAAAADIADNADTADIHILTVRNVCCPVTMQQWQFWLHSLRFVLSTSAHNIPKFPFSCWFISHRQHTTLQKLNAYVFCIKYLWFLAWHHVISPNMAALSVRLYDLSWGLVLLMDYPWLQL